MTVSSQNLEKDSFELLLKQLNYDTEVYKIYVRRVLEVEHAAFYAKLQAKDRCHKNSVQAAEHFLAKNAAFIQWTDKLDLACKVIDQQALW